MRIAATTLSKEEFGLFIIIRRAVAIGFPIFSFKLGMSLSKFASKKDTTFLKKSLYLIIISHVALFAINALFSNKISYMIFGTSEFSLHSYILVFYIFGVSYHSIVHGYFRGVMNIFNMNLAVISLNGSALIATVFLFFNQPVPTYYVLLTILILLVSTYYFIVAIKNSRVENEETHVEDIPFPIFFKYGLSRLPSGFFYSGLLALPVFIATHWLSLESAGDIGISISIIGMVQIISLPLGTLFLPFFAQMKMKIEKNLLKEKIQTTVDFLLTGPHLIGLFIMMFTKELIEILFSSRYLNVLPEVQVLSVSLGFLIGFIIVRSVLDGIENYPYVNIITAIGLLFFTLSVWIIGEGAITGFQIILILSLAIGLLTITSLGILHKRYSINILTQKNLIVFAWIASCYFLFFMFSTQVSDLPFVIALLVKMFVTLICFIMSFVIFSKLNFQWIHILRSSFGK